MKRFASEYLEEWKSRSSRKPLIIRGARQVGKTYLVRDFAKTFKNYLEINFENEIDVVSYFENSDPHKIINLLALHYGTKIVEGETLLFFDEIQSAPEIFARLRYFYEMIPGLHIIAAGSLLEFVLEDHQFSMPVGRIEYLHLGPMSFKEFLKSQNYDNLINFLENYKLEDDFSLSIHNKLISLYKHYIAIGGMPESIKTYNETNSYIECDRIKQSIIDTYIDDFRKYGKRLDYQMLLTAFKSIPRTVGNKVKYVNISKEHQAKAISSALHLFALAKICYPIYHSSANGVPLGAEINFKIFKLLFLDVGLLSRALGLTMADIETIDILELVNSGNITEQFIGQHLLYRNELYQNPELHYWVREKKTSNAEIDFVISNGLKIVPIEVKAGKTGSLKSLNQFITEKNINYAVRFNLDQPSFIESSGNLVTGEHYRFNLLSLPAYMVEELGRLSS